MWLEKQREWSPQSTTSTMEAPTCIFAALRGLSMRVRASCLHQQVSSTERRSHFVRHFGPLSPGPVKGGDREPLSRRVFNGFSFQGLPFRDGAFGSAVSCFAFTQLAALGNGKSGMASLSIPSWNQITSFLESMRQLRDSAGFAA
jgi:hypothetical protein